MGIVEGRWPSTGTSFPAVHVGQPGQEPDGGNGTPDLASDLVIARISTI